MCFGQPRGCDKKGLTFRNQTEADGQHLLTDRPSLGINNAGTRELQCNREIDHVGLDLKRAVSLHCTDHLVAGLRGR